MNHRTPILLFLLLIISSLLLWSTWLGGQTLQQDMHQEKKQGEDQYKAGTVEEDDDLDFEHLMGAEECVEGDEFCIKRRMTAEAHLDYIYTQQHKP
ncbi:hypothetical protein QQ045_032247 [Rhodiola kirilowii]